MVLVGFYKSLYFFGFPISFSLLFLCFNQMFLDDQPLSFFKKKLKNNIILGWISEL